MLRLRAFGGLTLEDQRPRPSGAITQPRSLALLALLANAGERPISRDKVLAYLWPEIEPARAAHRLAQTLYALKHDLGVESLVRATNDLRLSPQVVRSDLQDFTDALERGDLLAAVALYRGPFLDGFYLADAGEFERWAETERAEYLRRYRAALEALAVADAQLGDANGAAEGWRRLLDTDPLNARIAAMYIQALGVAAGNAGALQFVKEYCKRLREEFETEPDAAVAAAAERLRSAASSAPVGPAIAVLPFQNLTPERDNEYFSDGMTVELASALAQVPGLRVVSRTSVLALKEKELDARGIGERLGVSFLVEGSLRKVGDRIRLHAQVVNAADGCDLWSQSYERTMEHVFTLQDELCRSIVAALPLGQNVGAPEPARQPTALVDAYTLYLRGRYSANKRTIEGLSLATEYFEQAVTKDPRFSLAHAGLAECWALLGFLEFGDLLPCEAMPKAKIAALEALRLDPGLAEGHIWLGVVLFLYEWNWDEAEREFRRALQLQPDQAYAETWYATFLSAMGRHEESLQRIRRAHTLEPLSLSIKLCIARFHYFARQYEAALAVVDEILRDEPGHLLATIWAVRTLSAIGRYDDALERAGRLPADMHNPYLRSCMAYALAGAGRIDEARRLAIDLRREFDGGAPLTLFFLAGVQARLGELDAALESLMECRRMRDGELVFLSSPTSFEALRGHPDFERLVEEMRFPADTSAGNVARRIARALT